MYRKYFQLSQQFFKTVPPPTQSNLMLINCENYLPKRWAGHSKWQNVKSTKEAQNRSRNAAFQKLNQQIVYAVRNGGPNPATNSKLKALVEESMKISMPKTTLENMIKSAQNQTTDKPYWVVFSGPKGITVGFEVTFANNKPGFIQSKLNSFAKRLNLKHEPHFTHLCAAKGLIITNPKEINENAYESAMECALEIGVDEVHESDDKTIIFECSPDRIDSYAQKISEKGYDVHSSSVELDFNDFVTVEEEELENLEKLLTTVQEKVDGVVRASHNAAF